MSITLTLQTIIPSLTCNWSQQQKIIASDPENNDQFGKAVVVSADGNTAIVGAWFENGAGSNRGAAYIYIRSGVTWTFQQKIVASDPSNNSNFGNSVSIADDGDTVIVGAQGESSGGTSAGAAYIYTRSGVTWTQTQKLTASDPQANDQFGHFVSISGDGETAIIGAPFEDTGGSNAGAAYIFTRGGETWTEQQKIQAGDAGTNDQFGISVSISNDGDTAIVGADLEDGGGDQRGAAYIFTRSGVDWTQTQKLTGSDGADYDAFGYSVAISTDGSTAIVGAYFHDHNEAFTYNGSSYIFTRSGEVWTEQQELVTDNLTDGAQFGYAVSISGNGNTVVISAVNDVGFFEGSAFVFTRSNNEWSECIKLKSNDANEDHNFSESIAISSDGNTAIVGASGVDSYKGAAYIFTCS
jgi:hypothetical protein